MDILITGANGFLGKAIYNELLAGNSIYTLSRSNADIKVNLSSEIPFLPERCDLVIHCAGRAHLVPKSLKDRQAFFDVNVKGTLNLLKGIDVIPDLPKSFILISSVAVYGVESGIDMGEGQPLDAIDPYGQSKIEAEKLVTEWCKKNNVICTILRLPLLAGTNPPGNLAAMINGVKKGYYFNIGGGKAKKSIVLTSDVAKIIPLAAKVGGVYNLTDGYHPTFKELSTVLAKQLSKPNPLNMPYWIAKVIAGIGDLFGVNAPINSTKLKKIISDLTFDDSKARKMLDWSPKSVLNNLKI